MAAVPVIANIISIRRQPHLNFSFDTRLVSCGTCLGYRLRFNLPETPLHYSRQGTE